MSPSPVMHMGSCGALVFFSQTLEHGIARAKCRGDRPGAPNIGSDGGSPPIIGPVPYANSSYVFRPTDLVGCIFPALNTSILNCTVLGSNNNAHFSVSTDASMPGYTVFRGRRIPQHCAGQVEEHAVGRGAGCINSWLRPTADWR